MIDIEAYEKFLIAFQTFLEHIMLKPRDWALSGYLESIGAISFTPSVDTLTRRYERSYGDTVIDFFLANDVAGDETAFGTLWLFSENNCVELTNFAHEYTTKVTPLNDFATFSERRPSYERPLLAFYVQ